MPHVITRHQSVPSSPVFFVNYDDSYIMKVTTMQAGGGVLGSALAFTPDSESVYAINASTVGADETLGVNQNSYMNLSTDSGSTFTRTYTIGTFHKVFSLAQHYFKDLTNDQLIWHGTSDHVTAGAADNAVAFYTKDGGSTWNRSLLESYVGQSVVDIFAISAHDGRYAYIVTTLFQSPSTYTVKIYKVDSTDGSFTSITLAAGSWGTGDSGFFRGTVKLGNSDKLYLLTNTYGSLWTVIYSTNTSTLIYDTNVNPIDPQQGSHRQITCSPSGTLLWVMSNSFGVPSAFLYVFRSTDGTNWTKIDCSSLTPISRSSDRDYISFSSDTLFVAFERDGGVVYGMSSTDDGANWARTGNLYTGTAVTFPYDQSGVIAGG